MLGVEISPSVGRKSDVSNRWSGSTEKALDLGLVFESRLSEVIGCVSMREGSLNMDDWLAIPSIGLRLLHTAKIRVIYEIY